LRAPALPEFNPNIGEEIVVSAELILHNAKIATNGVIQGGNSPEKCDMKKRRRGQSRSRALHYPGSAQAMDVRGLR
jgi:hypothetical protein